MSNKRYSPAIRRELVLKAAVSAAGKPGGWARLTREAIAREADCSDGLVSRYLGDMPDVRKAVMRYAVRHEILEIIAQSVASHDGYAVKKNLKHRAIASLLG
jgi:AcrR family transcriptional regulator